MKVEASLISEEVEGSGKGIVEALKKVVEVSKEVLKWVAGLLEDEAEEREGEEGEDIPILPLTESVVNCDFQVVLEQCGPHKDFGWRTVLVDSWTSHGGGSRGGRLYSEWRVCFWMKLGRKGKEDK